MTMTACLWPERFARFDPLLHDGGDIGDDGQPMAARPLELWADIVDDHLGHARTKDLEFGAMRRLGRDGQETERAANETEYSHRHALPK